MTESRSAALSGVLDGDTGHEIQCFCQIIAMARFQSLGTDRIRRDSRVRRNPLSNDLDRPEVESIFALRGRTVCTGGSS